MSPPSSGKGFGAVSTESVLQFLEQRIARRREVPPSLASSWDARPYQLAAAVLHVFDPGELRPHGPMAQPSPPDASLFADSVPAVGWREQRLRSLKLEMRQSALKHLGSREAIGKALEANPGRVETPLQSLFERWVQGVPIEPERLRYADLECLRQLSEWGLSDDRFGGFPDLTRIEVARTRRATTGMFEHLVDENFVGRISELQQLRDYVGVVSPSKWERVRSFVAPGPKAPMIVVGPGGMGKTALVGKFLLEHVESTAAGWFPFSYLTFDSDTIDVSEPFTLLIAAASQLDAQVAYGERRGTASTPLESHFNTFRDTVAEYRDRRGALSQRAGTFGSQSRRLGELKSAEDSLYASFAGLLTKVAEEAAREQRAQQVPVLLVFDTFEEVLYRTREHLTGFLRMLAAVQKGFPRLRMVLASRAEPRPFEINGRTPTRHILGDLREGDATALLVRLGIADTAAAHAVVQQIGGNPLTLRLAARVAQEESVGPGGIRSLETRQYFVFSIAPELIRGQLYRRILDHIHDPGVRAIAHPGMVLRRVTPDVISGVLAPVCLPGTVSSARAQKLFNALRQEHALVSLEEDGSLRYREEVRRPVLELLTRDKPDQTRMLHQAAAEFYRARVESVPTPDPADAAEAIYHKLMLGEEGPALDAMWIDGVERYLYPSLQELPPVQRMWLAHHMDIDVPPEVSKLADTETWERIAGRKALEALRHEGPEAVLKIFAERKDRTPSSPLWAIEARALLARERPQEVLVLLDRAIRGYPAIGNAGRLAELLWIRSQAELGLNEPLQAARTLRQLAEQASSLSSGLARVQALTELVEVDGILHAGELQADREALARELSRLSDSEVDGERSLVRLALSRLGVGYTVVASRLIPLVISDIVYVVQQHRIELRPILASVAESLDQSGRPPLRRLAHEIVRADTEEQAVEIFMDLMERVARRRRKPDPDLIEIVLHVMRAERASLRGATLAGLESYREPWELTATPEVAA